LTSWPGESKKSKWSCFNSIEGRGPTLAKTLLESLDALSEEEYDQLWAEEAEARYAEYKAGRTAAVNGDDVFARARQREG